MRSVLRSKDFRRVEALPRRVWQDANASTAADALTDALSTAEGSMRLRDVQAAALTEIGLYGGLFAPIGVGFGKTLISLLAPHMIPCDRPLLLLPAQLREVTVSKYCKELSEHWHIPSPFCDGSGVLSYGALSTKKGQHLLEEMQPDLIICDEVHYLKSSKAARTKRFLRYMRANPETRFVAMSGTVTRKSIREYWHLIKLALGDRCPLPLRWPEMSDWANALDENVRPEMRTAPGALRFLCNLDETPREGYRRRLIETPGVIATSESELGSSLVILKQSPKTPKPINEALATLREDWITPGGDDVSDSLDYYRKSRELALGFYYVWEWSSDVSESQKENWLRARSAWRQLVRQESRNPKWDTELLVWNAYLSGNITRDRDVFERWRELKSEVTPPTTKPVWYCETLLKNLNPGQEPCLIWVDSRALGIKLSEIHGWPYFGAGQNDTRGLLSHIDKKSGHAIVSIRAHGTGKNLQAYALGLILTPPSTGAVWEQLLGRLHRPGQESDEVLFKVWQHTKELRHALDQAINDASYIESTIGARQKLLYADIIRKPKT